LDVIYSGILKTSPDPLSSVKWIRAALTFEYRYREPDSDAWYFSAVLESSPGEKGYLLGPLSSLIRIEKENRESVFHFYHKSLSDFLRDPQRSGDLHIPNDRVDDFEASRYSAVLKSMCAIHKITFPPADWGADRGPQVPLPTNHTLDMFLAKFFYYLPFPNVLPPAHNHHHDAKDIDWWLEHHHMAEDAPLGIVRAFCFVHERVSI
jgi:hypothetical protein